MPLRHSLADLSRRAQVSRAPNVRLMDAQAAMETPQTLEQLTAALTRPVMTACRPKPAGAETLPRFTALRREGLPPAASRKPAQIQPERLPQPRLIAYVSYKERCTDA
jgi:hypothetical protein